MNINSDKKVSILIFASGNGSNAENIITYFRKKAIDINWVIITNNKNERYRSSNYRGVNSTIKKNPLYDYAEQN